MASVVIKAIKESPCHFYDRGPSILDRDNESADIPMDMSGPDAVVIISYSIAFFGIMRDPRNATNSVLISSAGSSNNPFFHAGCAYVPMLDELYITSNLLQSTSSSAQPTILISTVKIKRKAGKARKPMTLDSLIWQKLRPPAEMPMPAGAACHDLGVLYCSQGTMASGTGGLYYMPHGRPPVAMVTSYHGRDFNSLRDVAVHGSLDDTVVFFTDPCDGADMEIRPRPRLPNQVYMFEKRFSKLRVVADGFERPRGIAITKDGKTLYVGDGGAASARQGAELDPTKPATIYAFDIVKRENIDRRDDGGTFLTNKRVFAYVLEGVPGGITCDSRGNVYAGCGDGVEIWGPIGDLRAVIRVQGGVTSLALGKDETEIFMCCQQKLRRVTWNNELW